jgi:hypothetical protein
MERTQRRHAADPVAAQSTAAQSTPAQSTAAPSTASQTSAEQTAANRANARHSTGPRTPEGQARSSQNALKHGFYATTTFGQADERFGEDPDAFGALVAKLRAEYAPEGRHEDRIVVRLAMKWWRLERLDTIAQTRFSARLDQDADPMTALLEAEAIAPAEARLERAIARLHKDLLFLHRYRERERQGAETLSMRRHVADVRAQVDAETEMVVRYSRQRRAEEEGPDGQERTNVDLPAGVDAGGAPERSETGTDAGLAERESVERSAA